jgi:hypothetical protein
MHCARFSLFALQTDTTLFHQPSALSPSPPTSSFSLPDIHDALGQPSPGRTHPRAPSAHNQGRAGRIANAYGGWVGEGAGGGRAGRVRSRHGSSSNSGGVTSGAGHTSSDTNTREQQYSRRAGFASGNSATTQPGSSDGDNEEGVYRRSHTQQEVTPSYPDFDARPVPPEVRSRVLHMLDKDMQLGREEAWKEVRSWYSCIVDIHCLNTKSKYMQDTQYKWYGCFEGNLSTCASACSWVKNGIMRLKSDDTTPILAEPASFSCHRKSSAGLLSNTFQASNPVTCLSAPAGA